MPANLELPLNFPTPRRLETLAVRFTSQDIETAYNQWNCMCGPVAIACILGLTLDEVRSLVHPHYRGLMNPTEVRLAITKAGVLIRERDRARLYRPQDPNPRELPFVASYGMTRIQFGGPWTEADAHPAGAYHYTHWVASATDDDGDPNIFDCNWGWMNRTEFFQNMGSLAADHDKASGLWWPTHIYELDFPVRIDR